MNDHNFNNQKLADFQRHNFLIDTLYFVNYQEKSITFLQISMNFRKFDELDSPSVNF